MVRADIDLPYVLRFANDYTNFHAQSRPAEIERATVYVQYADEPRLGGSFYRANKDLVVELPEVVTSRNDLLRSNA